VINVKNFNILYFAKKIKNLFIILISVLILSIASLILIIRYIPYYSDVKALVVNSLMTTGSHKHFAKLFASNSDINKIYNAKSLTNNIRITDPSKIHIKYKNSKSVTLYKITSKNYKGYLLEIADPLRIHVGTTNSILKYGQLTTTIAKQHNALAAINGGGFLDDNGSGNGGTPVGIIIQDGKLKFKSDKTKYYTDVIGFTKSGVLVTGHEHTSKILNMHLANAVSFKPVLIVNGIPTIKSGNGGFGISSRTAIGQTADGKVLLLVVDGRRFNSIGATLLDVQKVMLKFKAYNAANLDGGSSTTLYYNGKIINHPSDFSIERTVVSTFYVSQ
jgi:exopolysaccharide biosynthesis protein